MYLCASIRHASWELLSVAENTRTFIVNLAVPAFDFTVAFILSRVFLFSHDRALIFSYLPYPLVSNKKNMIRRPQRHGHWTPRE